MRLTVAHPSLPQLDGIQYPEGFLFSGGNRQRERKGGWDSSNIELRDGDQRACDCIRRCLYVSMTFERGSGKFGNVSLDSS